MQGETAIAELSKNSEKTIDVLIGFLKKVRLRWTLLIFVSFVGLCASLVGPQDETTSQSVASLLQNVNEFAEIQEKQRQNNHRFAKSLPIKLVDKIKASRGRLSTISNELEAISVPNRTLEFFTLGAEFSSLASAVSDFASKPPPENILDWKSENFSSFVALASGYDRAKNRAANQTLTELGDETAVASRQTNVSNDLEELSAFADRLELDERTNEIGSRLKQSVGALQKDLAHFDVRLSSLKLHGSDQAADVLRQLESWNVTFLRTAHERATAVVTTASLKSGSISALGFKIPGLVINLLLPLLAVGLAVDISLTLRRTLDWARNAMTAQNVLDHLAIFPWIPILILGWRRDRSYRSLCLTGIAGAVHFSPPILLGYMVLTQNNPVIVSVMASVAILTVAAAQGISLWILFALGSGSLEKTRYVQEIPDPTADLLKVHLERIDVAWSTLMTISAAISIFFIAFLFVPASLLSDRIEMTKAVETRASLEVVYEQRLKEHRDTYEAWSKKVRDQFHDLTFLTTYLPEQHPSYQIAEALNEKPPLSVYPSAISNFDDIVTDDRAALAELDPYDLNDLVEILYRNDMGDLKSGINAIRTSLAETPLPADVLANIPEAFKSVPAAPIVQPQPKHGKVSVTVPGLSRPDVPLPIPYRIEVEKGGFAYRLTELPPRVDVKNLISFMEKQGFSKVAGFDGYTASLKSFDSQLGTLKLQIFGIEVDRAVANKVAPWLITFLLGLLLLRVVVANRVFGSVNINAGSATLLASTSISFLHGMKRSQSLGRWLTGLVLLSFPVGIQILIEWNSFSNSGELGWSTAALVGGIGITSLVFQQRNKLSQY